MWKIWANYLLPMALKSCPKLKKSPNLVTLVVYVSNNGQGHRATSLVGGIGVVCS